MKDDLKQAFYDAYVGEAKAALRLKVFAEKADEEGYPQIASLFRAIARSEEIHGERTYKMLAPIKSTEENLESGFEAETQIAGVAYDEFIKLAAEANDSKAGIIFAQARDVENVHAELYKKAMAHLMEETETTYYICTVCGYIADGHLPDVCPVCGVKKDKFISEK